MDGSARRLAVFEDVARKNTQIRFFYEIYDKAPGALKSALLILYGLKCYLSVNWKLAHKADIALFASYPNEHVILGNVRRRLRDVTVAELSVSKRNLLTREALCSLPAFLRSLPRLWRLAGRISRRLHFLPACRVFSTVTYYLHFRRLLARHEVKAVFIANHYSPECLALAAVAHRAGRKVIFANHANATWRSGYVPQLHCDLAVLTSRAVLDLYTRDRAGLMEAVFLPVPLRQNPMRCQIPAEGPVTVGIFLTALTNLHRLRDLVAGLQSNPRIGRILIRSHPAEVVNDDLSDYFQADGRLADTTGMPLFDNIELCNVAICGNSTVSIELLRGGLPVFYDSGLDGLPYDYNGYLERDLVLPVPNEIDGAAFDRLARFYGAPDWVDTLRYFDAGYLQDEAAMYRRVSDAVRAVVERTQLAHEPQAVSFAPGSDAVPPAKLREGSFRI